MTTVLSPSADFVGRLSDSIVAARSLEELVRPLLEMLQAVTGLESAYVTAIDEPAGLQHVLFARNSRRLQIPEGLSVPWEDTLCKRALEEGRTYTDDVAACWRDSDAARALGIATYTSTPIRTDDGALYGTLCAASDERKPLADGAERVLQMFSRLIGQQVERERLVQSLRVANDALATSALLDPLTGLPNRRALMADLRRRVAQADREHHSLLIAFVDLDGFKAINDRYGHDAGDRFLHDIGNALVATLRAGDLCARLGGDEFVVLAGGPHESDPPQAAVDALHHRLQAATTRRFDLGDAGAIDYAGPSIGVIAADPAVTDPDVLLMTADAAMYRVKRARREGRAS